MRFPVRQSIIVGGDAGLSILFMRFPGKVVGDVIIVPNFQFSL